jgi:hypothetical protein
MLDTVFWIAVVVASLCGALLIGIELYEDWAEAPRRRPSAEPPMLQLKRVAIRLDREPSRLVRTDRAGV